MTYNRLCHEIRNLVQVAEATVLGGMKRRRDLRIRLHNEANRAVIKEYLTEQAESDADLLVRMRTIYAMLEELRKEHGVCDLPE
jgi:hypothetical protein